MLIFIVISIILIAISIYFYISRNYYLGSVFILFGIIFLILGLNIFKKRRRPPIPIIPPLTPIGPIPLEPIEFKSLPLIPVSEPLIPPIQTLTPAFEPLIPVIQSLTPPIQPLIPISEPLTPPIQPLIPIIQPLPLLLTPPILPFVNNGLKFSLYTNVSGNKLFINNVQTKEIDWYCGLGNIIPDLKKPDVSILLLDNYNNRTIFVIQNYNNKDHTFSLTDNQTGYYLRPYSRAVNGCDRGCNNLCTNNVYDLLLFRQYSLYKSLYKLVSNNLEYYTMINTNYNNTSGNITITSDSGGTAKNTLLLSTNVSSIYANINFYINIEKL